MSTDKDVKRREFKTGLVGVAVGVGAYLLDALPIHDEEVLDVMSTYFITPGYVLGAGLFGGAIAYHKWYFSSYQRFLRVLGRDGWLNRFDLRNSAGPVAMRKRGSHLRPDLPARPNGSRWPWRRHPVTEYATCVGEIVSGPRSIRGREVYSPNARGTLVLGPQGSGKSSWLAHKVFDFPGAAYVSSTKAELAQMTAAVRAQRGPVHIFNPSDFGQLGSSFGWDPVQGCEDQAVAEARAWALVRGGGGAAGIDRADFWASKAQEIVRCYLMAAALVGYDMNAVHHWATNPPPADKADSDPVLGILQANTHIVPRAWIGTLRTHLTASHNTRTGYFATVVSCVGFMDNPVVAAACRPAPAQNFDILEFLDGGTLFVISGDDKRLAPLITALTEHVFSMAKLVAGTKPDGRLPKGLAMILDEVAQTTPVPLDRWAADSRGWGVEVTAVVQDLGQLRTTWGHDRADTIYTNLPTKIVLPGLAQPDDLDNLAKLAGTRIVERVTEGESVQAGGMVNKRSKSSSMTRVPEPVIAGPTIFSLPDWHAYVLGLAPRAAVVKFEPGYERARREHRRLGKAARAWNLPQLGAEPGAAEPAGARAA